jgi:lysophospholipase L1-like esterase
MQLAKDSDETTPGHHHGPRRPGYGRYAWQAAAVALSPVLLVQGLRVRRVTPRLPEPPGPRAGIAGHGPPLRLLIAGDSAAAGVGAPSQEAGLSGAVVRELASEFSVSWRVEACNGLRTGGVLRRLAAIEPSPFDVVLLSLGVNDVTGGTRSAAWVVRQCQLVDLLHDRFGARHVLLTCLPPMHAFPALPQPLRWVLGERARQFTALLHARIAVAPGCEVVTPQLPMNPAYMAADGFHPGPPAYAEWGREAAAIIRRRLAEEALLAR